MSAILILCPTTKQAVPTGFRADHETFESSDYFRLEFKCPACGAVHTWSKENAWLARTQAMNV